MTGVMGGLMGVLEGERNNGDQVDVMPHTRIKTIIRMLNFSVLVGFRVRGAVVQASLCD